MKRIAPLAVWPVLAALAAPASAAPEEHSAVVNYPVKGSTASEIYTDIKTHAPRVAPNATFAFTAIATKTTKSHAVGADGCRYKRFATSAIYNFVIPKHQSGKLGKSVAKKWSSFTAYLQVHEEGHRDIWRKCFAEYDQAAMELSAKNCEALDKKREALFTKVKLRCVKLDEAYDVLFRKDVVNHPFMRDALRGPGNNRN